MSLRWGVAGPGGIAARFGDAMRLVSDGEIVAVASRSTARAQAYADRFDVAHSYDDYDALADDDSVDAVYVATPHARHAADTLRYLVAGKHVLCEKPFALNVAQGRMMIDAARAADVFLMEALWSRFLPAYRFLADALGEERIGEPLLVDADFGFRAPFNPSSRLFDPAQGGGALLDVGIYPLQLCDLVFGKPDRITSDGVIGSTGVDEQMAAILHHPAGGIGVVRAAVSVPLVSAARIAGTEGAIEIPTFMHHPDHLVVHEGGRTEQVDTSYDGNGLQFQIEETHRCIAEGRTESTIWPLAKTIELATTMDTIREQLGVSYPGESA